MQGTNRGKLVILVILAVAVAAASYSTWFHYQGSYRALTFWGSDNAQWIEQAPLIVAWELSPAGTPRATEDEQPELLERISIDGSTYQIAAKRDASRARGIVNIRRALVLDPAFDWDAPATEEQPNWQFALEFHKDNASVLVLFDFDTRQVRAAGKKGTAHLNQAANDDIRSFFAEQFEVVR